MQWNNNGRWTMVLLVGLGFPAAGVADERTAPASAKEIAQWILQLDDDSFSVRESASKNLLKSGKAAIEAVAAAATGKSLEVTERALRILDELALSEEGATARAAKQALGSLAISKHPAAAERARRSLRAYQHRIAQTLERCGARVQTTEGRIVAVYFDAAKAFTGNLRLLHELLDVETLSFSTPLMDDDGLAELTGLPQLRELNLYQSRVSDAGLRHLKTLPNLRRVPMGETRVTDEGLVHLKDLTQLEYLGLRGNQVTDAGLVHLRNLTNLTGLYLGETKVTDVGLVHLRNLTKLKMLLLDHTQVSDTGLDHLMRLTDLRDLDLSDTRVTAAGKARLKKALPQLQLRGGQP
jgi:Leucine-rich repeat (LRR) protein